MGRLDQLDLSLALDKTEEAERLAAASRRLLALRLQLGGKLRRGRSARPSASCSRAGTRPARAARSSASSRRSTRATCASRTFAAPDLRREAPPLPVALLRRRCPGWGGMAVLDRSWYGRVLVERVEGFATEEQWSRAYDEIVEFERTLAREGMILVKFWLHISDEEQLQALQARARTTR